MISTGTLFDLTGLTNLTHLDLRYNQLSGKLIPIPNLQTDPQVRFHRQYRLSRL
jgi:hypothetical protein